MNFSRPLLKLENVSASSQKMPSLLISIAVQLNVQTAKMSKFACCCNVIGGLTYEKPLIRRWIMTQQASLVLHPVAHLFSL